MISSRAKVPSSATLFDASKSISGNKVALESKTSRFPTKQQRESTRKASSNKKSLKGDEPHLGNTTRKKREAFLSDQKPQKKVTTRRKPAPLKSSLVPGKAIPLSPQRLENVAKSFIELDVVEVYKTIRKQTGALGGNAAGGAIYGEITRNSFQRVVDFLKINCDFSETSLFLDVGSGLGKPSFHVSIDPGVEISFGIELEEIRWHLSLHNLKSILLLEKNRSKRACMMFSMGDITNAATLNPFSHVYSFDVGFPPDVMDKYAAIYNLSDAPFLVSFHGPRKIIELYQFAVECMGQIVTSMAGSSEVHTCYFYRRHSQPICPQDDTEQNPVETEKRIGLIEEEFDDIPIKLLSVDPIFQSGFEIINRGHDGVIAWIESFFGQQLCNGRTRRQKALSARLADEVKYEQRQLQSYYRVVGNKRAFDDVAKNCGTYKTKKE